MIMNRLYIYILLLFFINCSSQKQLQKILSREKLSKILINEFPQTKDRLLVYSIDDKWYLIIENRTSIYKEYYIKIEKGEVLKREIGNINKPDLMLDNAFNLSNYKYGYVDFSSDEYKYYKLSQGNKTYFCLFENGDYYGEFNLSVIVDPIPIEKKLNEYLIKKIFKEISIDNKEATH